MLVHIFRTAIYHQGLLQNWLNDLSIIHSLKSRCQTESSNMLQLCGQLHVRESHILTKKWKLVPLIPSSLLLFFHHLEMMYSKQCGLNGVVIQKLLLSCFHKDVYCGYMPAWNESCPCKEIDIHLYFTLGQPSRFNMSYYIRRREPLTVFTPLHIIFGNSELSFNSWKQRFAKISQDLSIYIYTQQLNLIEFIQRDKGVN